MDEKFYDVYCLSGAILFLWHNSPTRPQAALLLKFLDYTELDTQPVGLVQTSDQFVAGAVT